MIKLTDLMYQREELDAPRNPILTRMRDAANGGDDAAFDKASTELDAYDKRMKPETDRLELRIKQMARLQDADRADPGTIIHGDEPAAEIRSQSIAETISYAIGGACDRAKVEREQAFLTKRAGQEPKGIYIATELFETRATQTTATSATIVPVSFRPDLFTSALTNSTVMQALGATVLTGLTGNVVIPRETGSPNVGWVNEDQALPTGNAAFDSLTLTPRHVGAITELSRQLIMQASPAVDGLIRQMLARNISIEIDRAAINGSGTGAEPKGILNDTAVPTQAWDTDLFTTTALMMGKADLANVSSTRGFVSTNGIKGTATKTRDQTGHPIPFAETFHGEPVQFSNQVPSTLNPSGNKHGLVYGDWSDFLIGIWSQLDILVNPYAETAYSKGNILIRAMATVDFGVRRPASFVRATGVVAG